MDKRYQVFVSSTYDDLQEERREVIQALLELDAIPAGMEMFPAADESQWALIKQVIDDCDYYIVIVGGRYGSVGPDGTSYTEAEYRYALGQGKPIIAFLHKAPDNLPVKRTDQSVTGKAQLVAFRSLCQKKMVKYWTTPAELGSVVSRSLVRLIKDHPAIGWMRADAGPSPAVLEDLLKKTARIEELEIELQQARTHAPPGADKLASGEEPFRVAFAFTAHDPSATTYAERESVYKAARDIAWNYLFGDLAPLMMHEASERQLIAQLNDYLATAYRDEFLKRKELKNKRLNGFRIDDADFQTIKVQLTALGLITKSIKPRSVKDRGIYWALTQYGEQQMIQLRAIKKGAVE